MENENNQTWHLPAENIQVSDENFLFCSGSNAVNLDCDLVMKPWVCSGFFEEYAKAAFFTLFRHLKDPRKILGETVTVVKKRQGGKNSFKLILFFLLLPAQLLPLQSFSSH